MATERQIAANRRNALKSTGPRTAAGKAASARNAIRHGLYSVDSVVPAIGESDASFLTHLQPYLATAVDPADPIELSLLRHLATLDWQLSRARREQAGIADYTAQALWDRSVTASPAPALSPDFGPFAESASRGPSRLAGLAFVANSTSADAPEKLSRIQARLYGPYFRALKALTEYRNKPNRNSRKQLTEKDREAA